jgi:hypothetical protein
MAKAHLKLVTPSTVNRTVMPRRLPNAKLRTREYLTKAEVERVMEAAKGNRYGHRDATMILVAYPLDRGPWWTSRHNSAGASHFHPTAKLRPVNFFAANYLTDASLDARTLPACVPSSASS